MISEQAKKDSASNFFREACQIAFLVRAVQTSTSDDFKTHVFTAIPLQKVKK